MECETNLLSLPPTLSGGTPSSGKVPVIQKAVRFKNGAEMAHTGSKPLNPRWIQCVSSIVLFTKRSLPNAQYCCSHTPSTCPERSCLTTVIGIPAVPARTVHWMHWPLVWCDKTRISFCCFFNRKSRGQLPSVHSSENPSDPAALGATLAALATYLD